MQKIKIYQNYGVLSAEKRSVYTYNTPHALAVCSDVVEVIVPDGWKLYKNEQGECLVESPWNWCYEIDEVLTDVQGHPVFKALDRNGKQYMLYLYTAEELEEKKKKEKV